MTPLRGASSMFGDNISNNETGNSSFEVDDSGMDVSSVVSSPPRSARPRAESSLFREDYSLQQDFHRSHASADVKTPKHSRRLFGDTAEVTTTSSTTLKPIDLNHHELNDQATENMAALTLSSATRTRRFFRSSSTSSSDSTPVPPVNRKRTSGESSRYSPKTPYRTLDQGNSLFPQDDNGMHTSPHISPNSFMTLDGRYVQSKNPFSSPHMDHDNITPKTTTNPMPNDDAGAKVPAFPLSFTTSESDDSKPKSQILPRRQPPSHAPLNGGFPDRRFSFTGSPIAEQYESVPTHASTDAQSSGSLHKVRRFSRNDDVVAATGQHVRNLTRPPPVNTAVATEKTFMEEDISPTDVASFPPPTPMKSRRAPVQPPYASITRRPPTTPSRQQLQPRSTKTPHPSRFYGDFDVIAELGKGSFGTVYKVLSRLDGCMYAIKAAQRKAKGRNDRDRMLKEVYALAALSDQADTATFHIVRYHQAWMEDDRLYIQTELCTGTLTDEVQRTGLLQPKRRYKLLREILLALDFIHRHNMVHLDIKPDNIFLKNDQFKLGDFGLVTVASASNDVEEGDSRYMSMELLSGDSNDLTKSDIFSLGITMYELCLRKPLPMNGPEWQRLRAGQLERLPDTEPELAQFIEKMMHPQASLRPSCQDLLQQRQLLSDEQKALQEERTKVAHANMQLLQMSRPPPRKGLVRANTWNGGTSNMYNFT